MSLCHSVLIISLRQNRSNVMLRTMRRVCSHLPIIWIIMNYYFNNIRKPTGVIRRQCLIVSLSLLNWHNLVFKSIKWMNRSPPHYGLWHLVLVTGEHKLPVNDTNDVGKVYTFGVLLGIAGYWEGGWNRHWVAELTCWLQGITGAWFIRMISGPVKLLRNKGGSKC